ncbi:MAG: hypothetical protein ACK5IP_21570 [Paracoccus sp. (in: a-proteobacteria)]
MKVRHSDFPVPSPALRRRVRQERDARRGRLGAGRYGNQVKRLAVVFRLAFQAGVTGSPFGLEGPMRHALRGDLCRQGWRWKDADAMARELLDDAFRALRVSRPDWDEGQPEWTIHAGTLIERTRCARCHASLAGEQYKYCSSQCRVAHHMFWARRKEASGDRAVWLAINST